jgi:glutamate formiminotransferase/glutamate formiminotransferase/formiminotetrahydrofolate cyclodeaminase
MASEPIVECVPNFSEGRDHAVVDAIAGAIRSVPGVKVLDRTMDADHHRSVVTFAGAPGAVAEAAFRAVEAAVERIDLNRHAGIHPRIGAADVVPFVPVRGVTLAACVQVAETFGERVWRELGVPVYFYEAAARRPERVRLENIRRGQFERLRLEALADPGRRPDIGGPELHPTAGAMVTGARKLLVAFNVNLATTNVEIARRIARAVRESSGVLPFVKALGLYLASRKQAQVSMNLTDIDQTGVHLAFAAVSKEAERQGVGIAGCEIIGLIPSRALEAAGAEYLKIENYRPDLVLENRLSAEIE